MKSFRPITVLDFFSNVSFTRGNKSHQVNRRNFYFPFLRYLTVCLVFCLICSNNTFSQESSNLAISDFTLISKVRSGRSTYDYTFCVTLTNQGEENLKNVEAFLKSNADTTQIIDGNVFFGSSSPGESVTSEEDTITLRIDRLYRFDESSLEWEFSYDVERTELGMAMHSIDESYEICQQRIEELGDTEEARLEAVSIILNNPAVSDAGISLDGSIWIDFESGLEGVILLGPEGTMGGSTIQLPVDLINADDEDAEANVLIWNPYPEEKLAPLEELKNIFNGSNCLKVEVMDGDKCTVESVKKFPDYDIVIIITHAGYKKYNTQFFGSGQPVVESNDYDEMEGEGLIVKNKDKTYWGIKPKFITDSNYNSFQNSIIVNDSCNSIAIDEVDNDIEKSFAKAFLSKGAGVYLGFDNYVRIIDAKIVIHRLIEKLVADQLNVSEAYLSFNTDTDPVAILSPGGTDEVSTKDNSRCSQTITKTFPFYQKTCLEKRELDENEDVSKESINDISVVCCPLINGFIAVDGNDCDWCLVDPVAEKTIEFWSESPDQIEPLNFKITNDEENLYFLVEFAEPVDSDNFQGFAFTDIFIDTDFYAISNGPDFLLSLSNIPSSSGSAQLMSLKGASLPSVGTENSAIDANFIEASIPISALQLAAGSEEILFNANSSDPPYLSYKLNEGAIQPLEEVPGAVMFSPSNMIWGMSPSSIQVNSSDADEIYCTIETTIDGSTPPDPSEPNIDNHDPIDQTGTEFILGSSDTVNFWGEPGHAKKIKIRCRGKNHVGYGPTSEAHAYQINFFDVNPAISQAPLSGPNGTECQQRGIGFTPESTATLYFKASATGYTEQVNVSTNAFGHFNVAYIFNKTSGNYSWWAVDDTTGTSSNEIDYTITDDTLPNKVSIPKTGQTITYKHGDDGDLSTGVSWPEPRFVDNNDGTIVDNLTGLMWTKRTDLFSGHTYDLENFVNEMNSGVQNNYGYTDWRLPNIIELNNILGAVPYSTEINLVQYGAYGSSTTCGTGTNNNRMVWHYESPTNSNEHSCAVRYYSSWVWPVRMHITGRIKLPKTGQSSCYNNEGEIISCENTLQDGNIQSGVTWPTPRFIDNNDGTVSDKLTGLMWTRETSLVMDTEHLVPDYFYLPVTWDEALNFIEGMNAGIHRNWGYTDWRLPNKNELMSVHFFDIINETAPPDFAFVFSLWNAPHFSSTTAPNDENKVWIVHPGQGARLIDKNEKSWVWAVRGSTGN